MNFNKVILGGNMTRDVDLRHTPAGNAVANFGIAINYKRGDHEDTTFVDCEAWGQTAETILRYFSKGKAILIEGRLKLDQWQAQDGTNRSKLKVVVETFSFVDSKAKASDGGPAVEDSDIPF